MATYSNVVLFNNSVGIDTKIRLVKSKKKEGAINASDQIPDGGFIVIVDYPGTRYVKITDGVKTISEIPKDGEGGGGSSDASTLNGQPGTYYRDRANHTGTQGINTISGLQSALNDKADSSSLGTAATADVGDFATAAQGELAENAVPQSQLDTTAAADTVVLRKTNGRVETGTAVDGADAVNLTQFNSGLEGKQNTLATPSQAEAEAGTSTTARAWTAQRVRQGVIGASRTVVSVTGNKTLALTDEYTFQNVTAASTITVPANATVELPVGSQIDFFQAGAGVITFAAAGGVTIISKGSTLATTEAGDAATLKKTATNTWALIIGG